VKKEVFPLIIGKGGSQIIALREKPHKWERRRNPNPKSLWLETRNVVSFRAKDQGSVSQAEKPKSFVSSIKFALCFLFIISSFPLIIHPFQGQETTTVTIRVKKEVLPLIIGKGGSQITALREKHQVRIITERRNKNPEQTIRLKGLPENVDACKDEVAEILKDKVGYRGNFDFESNFLFLRGQRANIFQIKVFP
jgi:predicted RNA-binding protein YlqC (UPF0109 family)